MKEAKDSIPRQLWNKCTLSHKWILQWSFQGPHRKKAYGPATMWISAKWMAKGCIIFFIPVQTLSIIMWNSFLQNHTVHSLCCALHLNTVCWDAMNKGKALSSRSDDEILWFFQFLTWTSLWIFTVCRFFIVLLKLGRPKKCTSFIKKQPVNTYSYPAFISSKVIVRIKC